MSGNPGEFAYDIAFSLLSRDMDLAQHLADCLAPLRCFVFTREQRDLVGRNGVEAFAEVFRRQSRLAVVLFRQGYGETEYTDLEVRGIQDRAFETRWLSPILINLDGTIPPVWFPKRNIWLDLQRYPIEEAVGAIRLRAEELGAAQLEESGVEYLRRASALDAAVRARRDHEKSELASKQVEGETQALFAGLEANFQQVMADLRKFDPLFITTPLGIAIATRGGSIVIDWRREYRDSILDAGLYVKTYDGYVSVGGRIAARTPRLLSDTGYTPSFEIGNIWKWVPDDGSRHLMTGELAEHLMKQLVQLLFGRQ